MKAGMEAPGRPGSVLERRSAATENPLAMGGGVETVMASFDGVRRTGVPGVSLPGAVGVRVSDGAEKVIGEFVFNPATICEC
jgi:hypothetical protein